MKKLLCILSLLLVIFSFSGIASAVPMADFVFIIDATGSMAGEINSVKNGLGEFVAGLDDANIDFLFSVVLYGGAPELVLDWTDNQIATENAFDSIRVNGAVSGFQNNHNVNPEAGLEAIRIVLGDASNNTLLRNNVGGTGPLDFRDGAIKNLILVTDEDSDRPFYTDNRQSDQTSLDPPIPGTTGWQTEIDNTAQSLIDNNAFINLLINPNDSPSLYQYGSPGSDVSDADFLNFDSAATYAALQSGGYGNSLQAQVLGSDLIGRTFNITNVDDTDFIDNFFAAKVEEVVIDPIPEPSTILLLGIGLLGVAVTGRKKLFKK